MTQIDPWALPQNSAAAGDAGIPNSTATPLLQPLSKALPITTMIVAGLYAVASLVAILTLNSRVSLMNTLNSQDPSTFTQDTLDRANAADSHVTTAVLIAGGLFIVTIVFWIIMQRKVKAALPTGAYQAVYKRAGGPAVRIVSWASVVLVVLSQSTSGSAGSDTASQLISTDHRSMVYLGLRVVLGALISFYAYRLMRVTTDGIARINAAR